MSLDWDNSIYDRRFLSAVRGGQGKGSGKANIWRNAFQLLRLTVFSRGGGGKAMKSYGKRRLATNDYWDSRQGRERCASFLGSIL
jgi:hypothetical protein